MSISKTKVKKRVVKKKVSTTASRKAVAKKTAVKKKVVKKTAVKKAVAKKTTVKSRVVKAKTVRKSVAKKPASKAGVRPKARVQTAEGWRRKTVRVHRAKKKA